jgi:hypothetical protein
MTDEQNIVYTLGILLQAYIECQGMIAENGLRKARLEVPAYTEKSFIELRDKHAIHHNGLLTMLLGR